MATRSIPRTARKQVNYSWAGFLSGPQTIPPLSGLLLGSFVLSTPFDETAVRCRGQIFISSDQSVAVESQIGAFGLIRITDVALVIGPTAIPFPSTNDDSDGWFVWQGFCQESALTTAGQLGGGVNYEIDSKAQRIVREGQVIAVMAENRSTIHGLKISTSFRLLARFRG